MRTRTRRSLTASTSAAFTSAALAAGMLASVPAAHAAATPAKAVATDPGAPTPAGGLAAQAGTSGAIALNDGRGHVVLINPDGTGKRTVPNLTAAADVHPAWSPDGSRLTAGDGDRVATARAAGTSAPLTLPAAEQAYGKHNKAVYTASGSGVLYTTGRNFVEGPSDGSWQPLSFDTTDECATLPAVAPDDALFFQAGGGSCGAEYRIRRYDRGTGAIETIVEDGRAPALNGDGSRLVFVRQVGEYSQLFTADADGTGVTQISKEPYDHENPSWDPAGNRIVHEARGVLDGNAVNIVDLDKGTNTTLTKEGSYPAWQPLERQALARVYGTGDIGIDQAAARWTYDKVGEDEPGLVPARSAVLVNKDNATYAAPAIALASSKQGPVLHTAAGSLSASAVRELQRSLPRGSTVYLTGGTNQLSTAVEDKVKYLGYKPVRLGGTDLATVSTRVATQISATPGWIFLADGNDFHDPYAAAAAAGALGYKGTGVVLLTRGKTLPATVKTFLNSRNPYDSNVVTVGSNARYALEHTPLEQQWQFWAVAGSSHEDTAAKLAEFWWTSPVGATVLDRWTWQNAAPGAAATATHGPLLWSNQSSLSAPTQTYLGRRAASIRYVETFGGNASYSPAMRTSTASAVAASSALTDTFWLPNGEFPAGAAGLDTSRGASPARPSVPAAGSTSGVSGVLGDRPDAELPAPDARTGR